MLILTSVALQGIYSEVSGLTLTLHDAIELCSIGDEYDEMSTQEDFDKLDEVFGVYWCCDSIVVLNKDTAETSVSALPQSAEMRLSV